MRKTSLLVVMALVITTMIPLPVSAEAQENNTYEGYENKEIEFDLSELSEEELQYVPKAWREGNFQDTHPEETSDESIQLQASYPDVNNYIKSKKLKVAKIDYDHKSFFPKFGYRGGVGKVEGVVAHETANPNYASITNEIKYMSRNWHRAFVHSFIDDNQIIEIHPTKYAAWGAGPVANQRYVHIELIPYRSSALNFDKFARSINNYADYIARILFDYNLGVKDAERSGKGTLWSHNAVSKHLGGTTHTDPHGYFSTFGYSWNEFVELVNEKYNSFVMPRVSGDNRYHTAAKISQQGWNTANTVVLARGDDYADALSGVPLAKKYDAPLLLTQSNNLTDVTERELKRLKAKNVYVLGGTSAISNAVVTKLEKLGIAVERIQGENRIETAVNIANNLITGKEQVEVMLVDGYEFADALAAAPYAAEKGIPILLTRSREFSPANEALFQNQNISRTYVVGGTSAIADKVVRGLPNVKRINGKDRYATAVALAKHFKPSAKDFYVTTGRDFPDSLAAAALASKQKKGLILVRDNKLPVNVENFIEDQRISKLTIIGGTDAVNRIVEREMKELLN